MSSPSYVVVQSKKGAFALSVTAAHGLQGWVATH
jgi:hypothetical protein